MLCVVSVLCDFLVGFTTVVYCARSGSSALPMFCDLICLVAPGGPLGNGRWLAAATHALSSGPGPTTANDYYLVPNNSAIWFRVTMHCTVIDWTAVALCVAVCSTNNRIPSHCQVKTLVMEQALAPLGCKMVAAVPTAGVSHSPMVPGPCCAVPDLCPSISSVTQLAVMQGTLHVSVLLDIRSRIWRQISPSKLHSI